MIEEGRHSSEIVRLLRKTGSDWRKIKVTRLTLAA